MAKKRKLIVDVVNGDSKLQKIIGELKEKEFLLPGIFDPRAYLRDTRKIESAWEGNKSRINAIAVGTSRYNEFVAAFANRADGIRAEELGELVPLKELNEAVEEKWQSILNWRKAIKRIRSLNLKEIEEVCNTLGQYLEYLNRKSQGFK